MKKVLKTIICILLVIVLAAAGLFSYLTITEFKPDPVMPVSVSGSAGGPAEIGSELNIVTWNIGYCGLGAESDFFMDGGSSVQSADKATSARYLSAAHDFLDTLSPDIAMLQETDVNSQRSYHVNQTEVLTRGSSAFAKNYSCDFVPFPWPPIGKVQSGVFTTSLYSIDFADRISLPCPFSWPVSTANLKRCLLASYIPVQTADGTVLADKYLVIVNLHLEAYDNGEGKIAQTKMLREFMAEEYAKGNYVIAGGDFNQQFPGGAEEYDLHHPECWLPGDLDYSILPEGWNFAYDTSTPTCRLLNQPYDPSDVENTDYYVIDGFILSPNVELTYIKTVDLDFENSDHNPVNIHIRLLEE